MKPKHVTLSFQWLIISLWVDVTTAGGLLTMCRFVRAAWRPECPPCVWVLWPSRAGWEHKGTSSQPGPAVSMKCQRGGKREAISGSHPKTDMSQGRHTHISQNAAMKAYSMLEHTGDWRINGMFIWSFEPRRPPKHLSCQAEGVIFFLKHPKARHDGTLTHHPSFPWTPIFCGTHLLPTWPLQNFRVLKSKSSLWTAWVQVREVAYLKPYWAGRHNLQKERAINDHPVFTALK